VRCGGSAFVETTTLVAVVVIVTQRK